MKTSNGFTIVELIVVISVVGILAALAIPNWREARVRAYDATAQSDFRNLKTVVYAESSDPELVPSYIILNQMGPGSLTGSLANATLSEDVQLDYAIRLNLLNFIDLQAIQLSHRKGDHYYRLIEVNGERVEQTILK